jgi:hypothetical protein
MPNRTPLEDLAGRIEDLQRKASEAGRGEIPVSQFGGPRDADELKRYEEAGVRRVFFRLPSDSPDDVERRLEELAKLVL